MRFSLFMLGVVGLHLMACPAPEPTPTDAGSIADAGKYDAGEPDAGVDAGPIELPDAGWERLTTVAYNGKQDDISFVSATHGWYVNGAGFVYETTNGGASWAQVLHKPGTFWRAVGFIDEQHGLLGNLGPGVFPGVSDATPLYVTSDGARTVTAARATGAQASGICGIDVLRTETGVVLSAAGRVGGPAHYLRSADLGTTWSSADVSASLAMITDVKFLTPDVGFLVGGTTDVPSTSHAVIVKTVDGGATWTKVYESPRAGEVIWKLHFPTADVGYATIQSYASGATQQRIARTTNGGESWTEKALVVDGAAREFGIAFVTADIGWVGTSSYGLQTTDGAETWQRVEFGRAVNKIRVLRTPRGFVAYAIGVDVYKLNAER